jgi:hypothetical protein
MWSASQNAMFGDGSRLEAHHRRNKREYFDPGLEELPIVLRTAASYVVAEGKTCKGKLGSTRTSPSTLNSAFVAAMG